MIFRTLDPFEALMGLQRAMDSARSSDWFEDRTSSRGVFPPINVFRQGDDLVLVAEIPGADKSKIDLQVKNRQVQIRGIKEVVHESGASAHRRERIAGEFNRVVTLPGEVDADRIGAEYRNGVLAVYLPRAESDKPRTVAIN